MIKEAIATGDTVEQAFEKACEELGVESHEAEFEILEMPVKKTFGLFGGSPAKVRAYIKSSPAEAAAAYLKKVVNGMGLNNIEISIQEEESGALLSLTGEDIGFIIGHRGETLDALQYLANRVANKHQAGYVRVKLDTENYRARREETLKHLAKNIAHKVKRNRRPVVLEPMNPYERRIIHSALQSDPYVTTHSEGEDPYRKVVVTLKR